MDWGLPSALCSLFPFLSGLDLIALGAIEDLQLRKRAEPWDRAHQLHWPMALRADWKRSFVVHAPHVTRIVTAHNSGILHRSRSPSLRTQAAPGVLEAAASGLADSPDVQVGRHAAMPPAPE